MAERAELINEELESIDNFLKQVSELNSAVKIQVPIGTILVKYPLAQEVLLNLIMEELNRASTEATKRLNVLKSLDRVRKKDVDEES